MLQLKRPGSSSLILTFTCFYSLYNTLAQHLILVDLDNRQFQFNSLHFMFSPLGIFQTGLTSIAFLISLCNDLP